MAPEVKQYYRGVQGDQDKRFIRYLVSDVADDNEALDQLEINTPIEYDNMFRENITVREISKRQRLYEGTSQYTRRSSRKPAEDTNAAPLDVTGPNEPTENDPDKSLYSFEISVETKNETYPTDGSTYNPTTNPTGQRLAIVPGFDQGGTTRYESIDFNGFNFDPDYGFRGVELVRPRKSFSLAIFPEDSKVTRDYQVKVESFVGTTNSVAFRKHPIGSVMLMAARGESRNTGDWQFEFTFEYRPTVFKADFGNGVEIGSGQTVTSIQGWDRLEPYWVWRTVDFGGQPVTIRVCRQVTIWRDYAQSDFGELFI